MRSRNVALVAASTVLALMAGEAAVRVADRLAGPEVPPGGNHPRHLFVPAPRTGYALRPSFEGTMRNVFGDFQVPVRVSSSGLRDREEPGAAADLRIVGLGDSFTYGEGVALEDSYLAVVERGLAGRLGRTVRIFKAGVPGFSARQMLERFREAADEWDPHGVILGLVPSGGDRLDDPFTCFEGYIVRSSYAAGLTERNGRLVHSSVTSEPWRTLDRHGRFYSHAYRRAAGLLAPDPVPEPPRSARRRERLRRMNGILVEFSEECAARGAFLLVVLIDSPPWEEREMIPTCEARGIPYVRTWSALAQYERRTGARTDFPHDDHWNRDGHRVVADLVLEALTPLARRPAGSTTP
jgi:hypothetical protein